MYLRTRLSDNAPALIIARSQTLERLSRTCFRGTNRKLAGNFSLWRNLEEMFMEPFIREQLLSDILASADASTKNRTFSITIYCSEEVGWSSTDTLSRYHNIVLEPFEPNRNSRALRVKANRTDHLAPRTQEVTIVYELRFEEENGWVAVIHSVYPGHDIGNLRGDITARENRIFFDWNHPGV